MTNSHAFNTKEGGDVLAKFIEASLRAHASPRHMTFIMMVLTAHPHVKRLCNHAQISREAIRGQRGQRGQPQHHNLLHPSFRPET